MAHVAPYTSGPRRVVKYVTPEVSSVEEMMEPMRPLVKSDKPLTHPVAPGFLAQEELARRRDERGVRKQKAMMGTAKVSAAILAERKLIKAQNEFLREQRHAQQVFYRISKEEEFARLHCRSPFLLDLCAINERALHLAAVRDQALRKVHDTIEERRTKLRSEIITNACIEIDDAEERRKVHRRNLAAVTLDRSLRDVLKTELRKLSPIRPPFPPIGANEVPAFAITAPVQQTKGGSPSKEGITPVVSFASSPPGTAGEEAKQPKDENITHGSLTSPTSGLGVDAAITPVPSQISGIEPPPEPQALLSPLDALKKDGKKGPRSGGSSIQVSPSARSLAAYIAEQERETREHIQAEERAKRQRDEQLRAIQKAALYRLKCEEEEQQQQRENEERLQEKRAQEEAKRVLKMREEIQKREKEAMAKVIKEEKTRERRERKKMEDAETWRNAALGSRATKSHGPPEVRLYPQPPAKT